MLLVDNIDGSISIERFQSVSQEAKMVALSWRDEAAATAWRSVIEHRRIPDRGCHNVFDGYRMRVAYVTRD
jgi:heme-degrading monooxygenase HmoA